MQLKNNASVRFALAAAGCALLAESPVLAEGDDWRIDVGTLFYDEKDRVSIIEPVIILTREFDEEDFLSIRFVSDTMSGASPNGASVSSEKQTIPPLSSTAASGGIGSDTIIDPYALPVNDFSDQRYAVGFDWQNAHSRTFRSIFGANFSTENDYTSLGASINFQRDTDDKLTTFTIGLSLTGDSIQPIGGRPQPLTVLNSDVNPRRKISARDDDDDDDDDEEGEGEEEFEIDKLATDVLIGVTQVISRRMIMQLNFGIGQTSGYLTDPYKIISRVDAVSGSTIDYLSEKRPDNRLRKLVFWKTVYRFRSDAVHFSYRYYWDDWSIKAHTFEVKYRLNIGEKLFFVPNFRYYKQTGANFFQYSLLNNKPIPAYASADLRLAPMETMTTGLKVGYNIDQDAEINFRVEYMQQWGEDNPASAVGLQQNLTLFPRLEVMMYTFSFSSRF